MPHTALCSAIIITLFSSGLFADDIPEADSLPQLEVLPSQFISFIDAGITPAGQAAAFDGSFTVSGQGIYGHFDLVFLDGAEANIGTCSSPDRAYRRNRGSKVKSVSISCVIPEGCVKVQVYFHEMRLYPDSGPCMENDRKDN